MTSRLETRLRQLEGAVGQVGHDRRRDIMQAWGRLVDDALNAAARVCLPPAAPHSEVVAQTSRLLEAVAAEFDRRDPREEKRGERLRSATWKMTRGKLPRSGVEDGLLFLRTMKRLEQAFSYAIDTVATGVAAVVGEKIAEDTRKRLTAEVGELARTARL